MMNLLMIMVGMKWCFKYCLYIYLPKYMCIQTDFSSVN